MVCHRDGNMRNGVVYSVVKDGLQFLAVVSTSNAIPGTNAGSQGNPDYFRSAHASIFKLGALHELCVSTIPST